MKQWYELYVLLCSYAHRKNLKTALRHSPLSKFMNPKYKSFKKATRVQIDRAGYMCSPGKSFTVKVINILHLNGI